MSEENTQENTPAREAAEEVPQSASPSSISPRKLAANRKNSKRSTGPKTPEGKANSSQNATTHGIFAKQFLNGASQETIEEMTTLAANIREHYQPVGIMEELLAQKIAVEVGRRGRIIGIEQKYLTVLNIFQLAAADRLARYSSSTDRALFRAIEELERIQAARKAQANAAATESEDSDALPQGEEADDSPSAPKN